MFGEAEISALKQLEFDPDLDLYQNFLRARDIVPDAVALISDRRTLTYSGLAAAADRIASHLIKNGAAPGDKVAIIASRSIGTILAMAGILRAGCIYVPLDPSYATEQLDFVIKDIQPSAILWEDPFGELAQALSPTETPLLKIEDLHSTPAEPLPAFPVRCGDDACYVMYTSGSTGKPKGVVLQHRAISRLGFDQPVGRMTPGDVILHSSTTACDGSTWEIWPALVTGAAVAVVSQPKPALDALAEALVRHGVTMAFFYTGVFHLMIEHHAEALKGLKLIIGGGDVLSPPLIRKLRDTCPDLQIFNGYGPTENSVFTTLHRITKNDLSGQPVPIGQPTGHCDCFVLDDGNVPLEDGSTGQLAVAGCSVALGYLNLPERTAESFIDDPRPGCSGTAYLTGDMVRCRPDGVFEFLGRVDRQVKIGGRRIELDEIEHNLRKLPMLADAAVAVTAAKAGDKRITAFLKPEGEMPRDQAAFIRQAMAELNKVLPEGMLPRINRVVAEFPLTGIGKIDRKALIRSLEDGAGAESQPLQTGMDSSRIAETVISVWDGILGCGWPGPDCTFFEAGGTSLQLIDAHAELEKRLGMVFDITLLFEVPRLNQLSQKLAEMTAAKSTAAPRPEPAGAGHATLAGLPEGTIAIVGMAARLPGSGSLEEFWQQLRQGASMFEPLPPEAMEDSFTESERASGNYVPVRPGLPDAEMFDAKFFSMYPREAAVTDPQARVFLEICYEALENAGRDPWRTQMPVGVFAGSSISTYLLQNMLGTRAQNREFATNYQTGNFAEMTGNLADCLATRVAYKLDLQGPALTVQTACSTSLTAITQAVVSLRAGLCGMALAGGASITFPQKRGYLTQEGGLASDDGICRPFDAQATGTVFSHGAGVVVLRRLEDALADGDRIHAVIRGCGINNDGSGKISFTAPSVGQQAAAIRMAHGDAGIAPDTVSYVECHGTATPLGDPIELSGLRQAFGSGGVPGSCAIGSVKGNIGHLDAAAGVVSVIKTALMLQHREIPPVANFRSLNPKIDLAGSPFRVPDALSDWTAPGPLRAGVSSFGVGGTNVHLVLQEAPAQAGQPQPDGLQILPLSAKSPEALAQMQIRLAEALEDPEAPALADAAFTLQQGRAEFACRQAVSGRTVAEAAEALRKAPPVRKPVLSDNPAVAFMFPGQGSQYPGMGSGLYQSEPEFARWIDQGAEILRPFLGLDVKTMLCFDGAADEDLARALRETRLTQPALFLTQYACARLWMSKGIAPKAMIGHSVGEFTAATLAGVMDFETGLNIISTRGQLMQDQPGGAMLSVRAPLDALEPHLDGSVDIAARNAPKLNVMAGSFEAIEQMAGRLAAAGIACTELHTSHAFHSRMMDPVCGGLRQALAGLSLTPPQIPYVSCVTGTWIEAEQCTDPGYWADQARAAVRFADAVQVLAEGCPAVLLEVGAGNTLSAFSAQSLPKDGKTAIIQSLPDHNRTLPDDLSMADALGRLWCAGVPVDWSRSSRPGSRRVPLPSYPFQRKRHCVDPPADEVVSASPAAAPATAAASASEVPAMAAPRSENPMIERKPRLIDELLAILSDVSGEDLTPEDASATFIELGFDSLFLGQAVQQLTAEYGVTLTFRELLARYPTTEALADFLDGTLPPEAAAAPPEPAASAAAPQDGTASPAAPPPAAATGAAVPSAEGPAASLMQAQIAAMQNLFAQQLHTLASAPAAAGAAAGAAEPPIPLPDNAPASLPEPAAAASTAAAAAGRSFSIGRATNAAGGDLSPQQLEFAQDLARRYSAHSPKSKAYAQEYRENMADPRTASGFRAEWKELVYPLVCDRSKGARLWDIDGNEYIDLVNGFGQTAFGHSPDFVIEAVSRQMQRGFAIGPQCDLAGPLAKRFADMTGHQRATFCNTGSEAVMAAMRLARTVTGRERIVVFANDYHGQFDEVLVKGKRPGSAPAALPVAPGIPRSSLANMTVLPYGAGESLDWIRENAAEIAAVIVEPVQSRHPNLRPREFVQELRQLTSSSGAALVIDEVVTGFRTGPRGMQGEWGIQADLATYGKVVGGGMPIGMLAGSARFMDALDGGMWRFGDNSAPEVAPTFFAGTFVRHPLVLAALEATLDHLDAHGPDLWERTANRTQELVAQMNAALADRGLPALVEGYSSWFIPNLTEYDANAALLFPLMRLAGVHVQIGYPCILTTAHSEADFRKIAEVFEQSVDALRSIGILAAETDAEPAPAAGSAPAPTRGIPLTEAQREIWMTSQLGAQASCSFNESASITLSGDLDAAALQRALDRVIARHDGLRQVFARTGETFDILDPFALLLEMHDLSGDADPQATLQELLAQDSATEINLTEGPPLRAFLVRKSEQEHVLVLNAHHIVCDGWSFNVILEDLAAFYDADVSGREADLPPAPSFAACAAGLARAGTSGATLAYWRAQYAQLPELPELPADRPRPAVKSFAGATCTAHIPGDVTRAARKAGSAQGCTLFATLFAALQIAIARLSGSNDVVLGVPTGGQAQLPNSALVGHCVNFLPIRVRMDPAAPAADHLAAVRDQVMTAFEHQGCTYGTLVRDLSIERSLNRLPLTEIQFNLERLGESLAMGPLQATLAPNPKTAVNFDLFFNVVERRDGLRVDVDYNSDIYSAGTVQRWIGHLQTVLTELAADAGRPLGQLPVLTAPQQDWLAGTLNQTQAPLPEEQTLPLLFARQAEESPDAPAVEDNDGAMTYAQLHRRSGEIAAALQAAGIGSGGRVAVALPRSAQCLAALLAVMRTGNAYVPLDLSQPSARLRQILEAAAPAAILHSLPEMPGCAAGLDLAAVPLSSTQPGTRPAPVELPDDPSAYIMFTSGSTGTPKGVEIGHRSVINLLQSMACEPGFGAGDALLAVTTTMFDISVLELFLPLICGGKTVIAAQEDVLDGFKLIARLNKGGITHMQATPTLWGMLLEAGLKPAAGLTMLAGGEPLPADLAARLTAGGAALWNVYGPTETTIWSAISRIRPGDPVTIGRPVANTELHVLDSAGRLLPVGAAGELNIGGLGLAKGYFRREDLSASAFREVALNGTPRLLYKTGDIARRLADGSIQVLGRRDGQIKLRGFRIELGDIESALRSLDGVAAAAAALRRTPGGHDQLVGYVVAKTGHDPQPETLSAALSELLPGYMVPAAWVHLSSLPETANGKLDRKALPDPDAVATVTALHTAPSTPTERRIAAIWEEVLGIGSISTSQTLFALGMDSLTVFKIAARMIDAGLNLDARHLLQHPSIAQLAAYADSRGSTPDGPEKPSLKAYRGGARRRP